MDREEFVLNVLIADANDFVAGNERGDDCGSAFLLQLEAGFLLARSRCNKRIDSFLEFRGDQMFSVFGAVDRVDIIVGIGMAHLLSLIHI